MTLIEPGLQKRRGRPRTTKEESDAWRRKISSVARVLFIEDGYEGVSIRKIARKVPCSVSVLYNNFNNKREILQDIWDDIFLDSFKSCYSAANLLDEPLEKIKAFSLAYVKYWQKHPNRFRMIYLLDERESVDAHYTTQSISYLKYEWLTQFIQNKISSGELKSHSKSAEHIAEAIFSVCQGLAYRYVFYQPTEEEREGEFEIANITFDALLNGLFQKT